MTPYAPRVPLVSPSVGMMVHEIAPGDTLVSIARQYGLTLDELMALNGWSDSTLPRLAVGQAVVVGKGRSPRLMWVLPAPGTVQPEENVLICGTWDVADEGLRGVVQLYLDGQPVPNPAHGEEWKRSPEGSPFLREVCWEVQMAPGPHTATLRYTLTHGQTFAYRWEFTVEPIPAR